MMPTQKLLIRKKYFVNNSSFLQLILPDSKLVAVTNDTTLHKFPNLGSKSTGLSSFYQLFGCPKVNFGPRSRKQSHYSDVNHTLHLLIKPKGCKEHCTEVQSQTPAEHINKI